MTIRFDRKPARSVLSRVTLSLALLAPLVGVDPAVAQDDMREPEIEIDIEQDEELLAVQKQAAVILEEAASLTSHAWAGDYYQGDGLGMNISMALAPQGGVTATWNGCMGTYGTNAGPIVVRDDGTLQLRYAAAVEDDDPFPEQLLPVAWGERRYLIDPAEMIAFVNAINLDSEPRANAQGRFLLARGDQARPASGLPALPPRWLSLIRSKASEVRVTAVEPLAAMQDEYSCTLPFRVTLDHGADIGLVNGVELELTSPGYTFATIEIFEVDDATSLANLEVYGTTCAAGRELPAVGWVFSTGALGWSLFDDSPPE